ncbi:MAG: hypothetical protein JEZ02_08135 [Desulfatibacillum sp.]|nr:hypothetical protein [Desulfatibacillum sp.]
MALLLALLVPAREALSLEIEKKPENFGIYILRDGVYLPLDQTRIQYSRTWYPITYTNSHMAVCHLSELDKEPNIAAQMGKDDLLAIYFPGAADHRWFYASVFYFSEYSFRGKASYRINRRPEGWYAGFITMGAPEEVSSLLGESTADNYHFEGKNIKDEEILYKEPDLIVAQITPDETLPVSMYIFTAQDYTFPETSQGRQIQEQLPQSGYLANFPHIMQTPDFQARQDAIRRANDARSKLYLVTRKVFELVPDEVLHTGIFIDKSCKVFFGSQDDFRIVTAADEWGEKAYWPKGFTFARDYVRVRDLNMKAHRVENRGFSLLYEKTEAGTEVRLMGMKSGSKVAVSYSPMFAYDVEYEDHVEAGWEAFRNNAFAKAEEEFKIALEKLPDYPKALAALAWVYANAEDPAIKNPKEALSLAAKALQFKPCYAYVWDAASAAYYVNGDLDKAMECQESAYGKYSNPPKSYVEKTALYRKLQAQMADAQKYHEQEKYVEAVKTLQGVLAEMPQYVNALNLFARILATSKDPKFVSPAMAIKYVEVAYALAPENPNILDTVAECLYAAGDTAGALKFAQKARYYDLGNAHYQQQVERFARQIEKPASNTP